jgi:thioredoxin reductase (NADPH)
MHKTDIVIIGAGPAGLFAVFQAGILGMRAHVIDNLPHIGGQCSALYPEKPIYDIPAFSKVSGQELTDNLANQAKPFAPQYHLGQIVTEVLPQDGGFLVRTSLQVEIFCKVVIIAGGNGCFLPNKPTNLLHLEDFEDRSVFYSVTKKEVFKDKVVMIAGGGDSAIDWSIELADIAKKIYLVHRRKEFRCLPDNMNKILTLCDAGKVEQIIPYQLHHLHGEGGQLNAISVIDFNNNVKQIAADCLLAFFGLAMKLGPIQNWSLSLSSNHKIIVDSNYQTNIEGIYAIGDIATYPNKLKLILVGFSEASYALHHAYGKVFPDKALHFQYSTTKGIGNVS